MDEHYIIERRGGFAGLKARGAISGDALDPDDRATLSELLDGDEPLDKDPGADRYTYRVTRESDSGSVTREIPESAMPPNVANVAVPEI